MGPRLNPTNGDRGAGAPPQVNAGPSSGSRDCRNESSDRPVTRPSLLLRVLTPSAFAVAAIASALGVHALALVASVTFAASLVLEAVNLVRVLIDRARGPQQKPPQSFVAPDGAQVGEGMPGGHGEDVSASGPARLPDSAQDVRPTQAAQDGQDRGTNASDVPPGRGLSRTEATLGPTSGAAGSALGFRVGKHGWRVLRIPLVANGFLLTAFAAYLWVHPAVPAIVRASATIGAVLMWMLAGWTSRTKR